MAAKLQQPLVPQPRLQCRCIQLPAQPQLAERNRHQGAARLRLGPPTGLPQPCPCQATSTGAQQDALATVGKLAPLLLGVLLEAGVLFKASPSPEGRERRGLRQPPSTGNLAACCWNCADACRVGTSKEPRRLWVSTGERGRRWGLRGECTSMDCLLRGLFPDRPDMV